MATLTVNATEFKAKCLSLLDEIERNGGQITVTKRGRPVAVLGPLPARGLKSLKDSWAGKARILGDVVNLDASALWDVAAKNRLGHAAPFGYSARPTEEAMHRGEPVAVSAITLLEIAMLAHDGAIDCGLRPTNSS